MLRSHNFEDRARIVVKAGDGGNGCDSHQKKAGVLVGKPTGGHGGNGGNVIIEADPNLQTLGRFRYNKIFSAVNGKHGSSNKKHGANGRDCIIKVPIGTIIKDAQGGLVYKDLASSCAQVVIAKGGRGGRGNITTGIADKGEKGEERELLLELLLDCDVGLVGLPNSGKSSLISRISNAKPTVAPYPFSTRIPSLGSVDTVDFRFVCLDIPALTPGSHDGRGAGVEYVHHLSRCRLLYVVMSVASDEAPDPVEDFHALCREMAMIDGGLLKKERVLVANKIECKGGRQALIVLEKALSQEKVYPVSTVTGEGIDALLKDTVVCLRRQGMESR
ncbi:MAG: Obg family GTPase CgtA [Candidatus Omnitrophica bacterium]|nr:Obg family GTPase CgtA [Candidatus Omnitrophota bacterium]